LEGKIKENKVYKGKRKTFQSHEEDWLTKELVVKTLRELKPKHCSGFDRVFLVFLKDGASELSEVVTNLMFKILEKEKNPEKWKVSRILPLIKKETKKKQKTTVQSVTLA
jgi:hypothetical protein